MARRALRSFSEGGLRATESSAFLLEMPRAGARGASLCPTDPNRVTVDDDECPREFRIRHFCEESLERVLGFFDGGRPDSEPEDPCVGTHGKGPLIGEVFVEGHNDGVSVLRPGKDFCIGTSRQGDV